MYYCFVYINFIILWLLPISICYAQQKNDKYYCVGFSEILTYEICTKDYTDSLLIDTYGLKPTGIAQIHLLLYFNELDTNNMFYMDSCRIMRLFYRESLEKPYFMDRLLITEEEEIFFELIEKQLSSIVSKWGFFIVKGGLADKEDFFKQKYFWIDILSKCVDMENPHKIDRTIRTKLLKILYNDAKCRND